MFSIGDDEFGKWADDDDEDDDEDERYFSSDFWSLVNDSVGASKPLKGKYD